MSVVTCPGCNRAFTAGRSMCVHLYQSPQCRPKNIPSSTNLPFWLVPDELPYTLPSAPVPNEFDSFFHSDDGFPEADMYDDVMLDDPPQPQGDECLLDVVNFPQAYTTAQNYEAQLLKIIHTTGAPNGAFQSIMSWARSAMSEGYDFQPSPLAYDRQIHHLEKMVGMQSCRPTRVPVNLFRPDMEEDILDVVVFDFPTMLASLFNCPVLNKLENLVVNPTDRFAKYIAPNSKLGEVNSGSWYNTAYSTLVTDPDKDLLCPIIFAMDKTVISEMAGLSVFVILFTSSLFNREVSIDFFFVFTRVDTYLLTTVVVTSLDPQQISCVAAPCIYSLRKSILLSETVQ